LEIVGLLRTWCLEIKHKWEWQPERGRKQLKYQQQWKMAAVRWMGWRRI